MKKIFSMILMLVVLVGMSYGVSKKKRIAYVKLMTTLSEVDKDRILNARIGIGMSWESVLASWGKPRDINKTTGSWGVHEQWVYGPDCCHVYVYFENGICTSFQN